MSLIAAASSFGYFLAFLKVPALATSALLTLSENRIVLLLLINLLLIVLGCSMDMAPLILICAPILYPVVVTTLGMSPIQFGIMLLLITFVPFFSTFVPDLLMPEAAAR